MTLSDQRKTEQETLDGQPQGVSESADPLAGSPPSPPWWGGVLTCCRRSVYLNHKCIWRLWLRSGVHHSCCEEHPGHAFWGPGGSADTASAP